MSLLSQVPLLRFALALPTLRWRERYN